MHVKHSSECDNRQGSESGEACERIHDDVFRLVLVLSASVTAAVSVHRSETRFGKPPLTQALQPKRAAQTEMTALDDSSGESVAPLWNSTTA
jgi:hypothetical protein